MHLPAFQEGTRTRAARCTHHTCSTRHLRHLPLCLAPRHSPLQAPRLTCGMTATWYATGLTDHHTTTLGVPCKTVSFSSGFSAITLKNFTYLRLPNTTCRTSFPYTCIFISFIWFQACSLGSLMRSPATRSCHLATTLCSSWTCRTSPHCHLACLTSLHLPGHPACSACLSACTLHHYTHCTGGRRTRSPPACTTHPAPPF